MSGSKPYDSKLFKLMNLMKKQNNPRPRIKRRQVPVQAPSNNRNEDEEMEGPEEDSNQLPPEQLSNNLEQPIRDDLVQELEKSMDSDPCPPGPPSNNLELQVRASRLTVRLQRLTDKDLQILSQQSSKKPVTLMDAKLERIFSFLDFKSLKNVRLVCRQWNEKASPIFGDKVCWKNQFRGMFDGDFLKVSKFFETANPELIVHWEVPHFFALESDKFQNLLKVFGNQLKTLRITIDRSDNGFLLVEQILSDWCLNLNLFGIYFGKEKGKIKRLNGELIIQKPTVREFQDTFDNIGTLEVGGYLDNQAANLSFNIAKSCKILTKLRIMNLATGCHPRTDKISPKILAQSPHENIPYGLTFFQLLARSQGVAFKLEEFSWHCIEGRQSSYSYIQGNFVYKVPAQFLQTITGMIFLAGIRNKLKILKIGSSHDDLKMCKRHLPVVLKHIAKSLEQLTLQGQYNCWDEFTSVRLQMEDINYSQFKPFLTGFPRMEKLTVLNIKLENTFGVNIFIMLESFPNLQKFELDCNSEETVDHLFYTRDDVDICPHLKLRSLLLKNNISWESVLDKIVKYFPQLEILYVCVAEKYRLNDKIDQTKITLSNMFIILSNLRRLKEFFLDFKDSFTFHDVCESLPLANMFESLQSLIVYGTGWVNSTLTGLESELLFPLKSSSFIVYFVAVSPNIGKPSDRLNEFTLKWFLEYIKEQKIPIRWFNKEDFIYPCLQ